MIEIRGISKQFGSKQAASGISTDIKEGCIYGLTGSNGAGKTTLLRLIGGILEPDEGSITENGSLIDRGAGRTFFAADDQYVLPGASMDRMADFYSSFYKSFDSKYYAKLADTFGLDRAARLKDLSKGMRHLAQAVLALACRAGYLLLDEIFEGLDPVMRRRLCAILGDEVTMRGTAVVVSSHALRELEDICDHVITLHEGRLVLACDIDEARTRMFKAQIAYADEFDRTRLEGLGLDIADFKRQGSVASVIIRGDSDEAAEKLRGTRPLLFDILPMSFEEVFISELALKGYTSGVSEQDEGGEQ